MDIRSENIGFDTAENSRGLMVSNFRQLDRSFSFSGRRGDSVSAGPSKGRGRAPRRLLEPPRRRRRPRLAVRRRDEAADEGGGGPPRRGAPRRRRRSDDDEDEDR